MLCLEVVESFGMIVRWCLSSASCLTVLANVRIFVVCVCVLNKSVCSALFGSFSFEMWFLCLAFRRCCLSGVCKRV